MVCVGVFRVEADGLVEVGNGLVVLAHVAIGNAPATVRFGAFRVEPDGFVGVGNALVVLVLVDISAAPLAIGRGVFRVQADGLGKGRDGGVILLLLETGQTLLVGFRPRIGAGRNAGEQQDGCHRRQPPA